MSDLPIFTMLPISVANPDLAIIPADEIQGSNPYESTAYAHWYLGGSSASLTDQVGNKVLTPQSDGVSYPAASYLNMSLTLGKALLSDFGEVAAQTDTVCAVVRLNNVSGATRGIIGSIGSTTGGSLFIGSGPAYFQNQRGFAFTSAQQTLGISATTDWVFVAMSRDYASATKRLACLIGGNTEVEITSTNAYAPTAGVIGLGSAYLIGATAGLTMDVAEFIIFDESLGTTALNDVYLRSKTRMLQRGITVT